MLFAGRYIILIMGIFSVYTGFIYNEFFSKSMNLFGDSMWQINYNTSTIVENEYLILNPNDQWLNRSYAIGVDPMWQVGGNNKVIFQNSFKMKTAIIFGVLHMLFGLMLKACNYCHANDKWSMITVFAPQLIFLMAIFGYLAALMFIKWFKYSANNPPPYDSRCAPSILLTFINMVLLKSPPTLPSHMPESNRIALCNPYMFEWQYEVQTMFMMAAMLCIPWMAFGKPIAALAIVYRQTRAHRINRKCIENGDTESGLHTEMPNHSNSNDRKAEEIAEIFIDSGIHTIEFVLGSISHTASYLRLWALSLAHARLTEMLWNLVLCSVWHINGHFYAGICLSIVFAVWCALTLSILILMEGLSAFLHTLRLHWVEFQSKFYNGQGQAFQPFSFHKICNINNESLQAEQ